MSGITHSPFRGNQALTTFLVGVLGSAVALSAQSSGTAASGSVYVVTSDEKSRLGQVVVLDPDVGRVVGVVAKGYHPDLAVSSDGALLFVSYSRKGAPGGVFEVLDAKTGTTLHRLDEPLTWTGRGTRTYASRMALSRDGAWLFRFKHLLSAERGAEYWIETFDTAKNTLLPDIATLPLCGQLPTLIPGLQRDVLYVACPQSQDIRVLTLSARGASRGQTPRLRLGGTSEMLMSGFLGPHGDALTLISDEGWFAKLALGSGTLVKKDAVDRVARKVSASGERLGQTAPTREGRDPQDWFPEASISNEPAVLSRDGSRVYLIVKGRSASDAHQLAVLDSDTLERIQLIPLSRPYTSLAISADGSELYAVDTERDSVTVIDAASGLERKTITGVGPRPVFVVVAP